MSELINDLHGHLIGDEVLLLVAQLMRSSFRHGDRSYRFGGEAFVVLLHCPAADDARVAYERLRQRIEAHDFPQIGALTVSIGFTGFTGFTSIHADDTPAPPSNGPAGPSTRPSRPAATAPWPTPNWRLAA